MRTMVAYTPKVGGGVCVPKLLGGGGDGVKIVYGVGHPRRSTTTTTISLSLALEESRYGSLGILQTL